MKRIILCAVMLNVIVAVSAQVKKAPAKTPAPAPVVMKNLLDSFSYAAGMNIATNMKEQGISNVNPAIMQRAINDVFQNKKLLLTPEVAHSKLSEQLAAFNQKKSAGEKAKGQAFMA